jgi:methylenetetrahydrofolate dehydrogenase (NADP+)/methenyltetrahydrofolate cyclohydrolase
MKNSPKLLDGKWLASKLYQKISTELETILPSFSRAPGLAVVLVGDNPASQVYVANKSRAAGRCGFKIFDRKLPANVSQSELQGTLEELNKNQEVDGILLQLPLPRGLDQNQALRTIDPAKDADGLTPLNQGLMLRGGSELLPCTPLGALRLIDLALSELGSESDVSYDDIAPADLAGKSAIVIGRSILVGKPVSMLLLERNATVLMAHSKSANLPTLCAQADIVVAAVGVPQLVRSQWLKKNAIVIDVGINKTETGKLVGDVAFEEVLEKCSAITPVPGGVGPMTVAMLLRNTFEAYKKRATIKGK